MIEIEDELLENGTIRESIRNAYNIARTYKLDELVFNEIPWGKTQKIQLEYMKDTLKQLGISTILVADTSASVIKKLFIMQEYGFFIKELTSYKDTIYTGIEVHCIRLELK